MQTTVNGFENTGICLINSDILPEEMFDPA